MHGLTLKSWKSQGVTSLEGSGVRGLELDGDIGRPSILMVCAELLRSRSLWECDEVE